MKRRTALFIITPAIGLGVLLAGAFIFQDNLARFMINPRTPYQALPVPPAPDYIDPDAWALWPEQDLGPEQDLAAPSPQDPGPGDGGADVFYIHGTTHDSNQSWNSGFDDSGPRAILETTSLPNEIGPFAKLGTLFAPRYRQATLFSRFTHKYDGMAARALAYEDIRNAFRHYLTIADPERPLIIVGYDQGGLYVLGLLQEFILTDPRLQDRLVVAYALRHGVPVSTLEQTLKDIPPCRRAQDTGCLVSYNSFERTMTEDIERTRIRTVMMSNSRALHTVTDDNMLCVNPLSWRVDNAYASAENHMGGASATGLMLGQDPPLIKHNVGAQCVDGVLLVDKSDKGFLRRTRWFGRQWRPQPFNLFYADLREDGRRRLALHEPILKARYRQLDPIPIDPSIDLADSPINKVPR